MTIKIDSKVVYTVTYSDGEKTEVTGLKGLENHFEEMLGLLVDTVDAESWAPNTTKSRLKMFDSINKRLNRFKDLAELKESIDIIKNETQY